MLNNVNKFFPFLIAFFLTLMPTFSSDKDELFRKGEHEFCILKNDSGKFFVKKTSIELRKVLKRVHGEIESDSFYLSAVKKGVPAIIARKVISTLGHHIDWKTGLSGYKYDIIFEVFLDKAGNFVKTGSLECASFSPSKNKNLKNTLEYLENAAKKGSKDTAAIAYNVGKECEERGKFSDAYQFYKVSMMQNESKEIKTAILKFMDIHSKKGTFDNTSREKEGSNEDEEID